MECKMQNVMCEVQFSIYLEVLCASFVVQSSTGKNFVQAL